VGTETIGSEPATGTIWSLVPSESLTSLVLDTNESNSHLHYCFLYDPF
jgi:hypothetical protein